MNGTFVYVKWVDSYGVSTGWEELSDEQSIERKALIIESVGKVIEETDEVLVLAHNYADATANTPRQANGIMTIPKKSVIEVISLSSYLTSVLKQKPQQS